MTSEEQETPGEIRPEPAPVAPLKRIKPDFAGLMPLARPVGAIALVLLALFLAWQAWLLRAQQQASEEIQRAVEVAAPQLSVPLRDALEKVGNNVASPDFLARVVAGDAMSMAAATGQMRAALGDALGVTLYANDAGVLVEGDVDQLGYARAAQLARAQGDGHASIEAVNGTNGKPLLSVVQPVRDADRVLAFVVVELPFTPVQRVFEHLSLPAGRFDLRRSGNEKAPVLVSRGKGHGEEIEASAAIGDSGLWITAITPQARAWLPGTISPVPVWLLSLLSLAGAAVVGWGRRVTDLRRMQARGNTPAEPTFGEILQGQVAAPVSDAAVAPAALPDAPANIAVERSIFRAYDIRGVVGKTLNTDIARLIGQAIGSAAQARGQHEIVVGRDGRLSGPDMAAALIEGLRASGMDVIDIGMAPTPVVYFACYHLNTGSGVAVTGSHNPPDYNGFKIVLGGETLAEEAIQDLYSRIVEGQLDSGSGGLRSIDVSADYVERIAADVQTERPLKVVVDCGNGVAGALGPRVLAEVGCQVTALYDEVDGTFPNHHPDPSDPANLQDLILAVKHQGADLGIAFDGDGDRLGVVTRTGEIIYPDRQLMLFAIDVLVRDPGATIIYDVKCTGHLQSVILRHGGSPLMWKTGHSLIKAKMRETNAALAGEMSGHFFFRERWYGFDDGIYAAARLVEILAGDIEGREPERIFAALPRSVATPELKIELPEGEHYRFIERFRKQARFEDARVTTIDGLRADWPDGWGLVRASNTTPVLVLRFDADSENGLHRIQDEFRQQLLAVDADLALPF